MEVLVLTAGAVGIVVLALWPLTKAFQRRRSPRDQEQLTDTDVVPPRVPDEPIPGSRRDRRRRGKP